MSSSGQFSKEDTERVIRGDFKGLTDAMDLMKKSKQGPSVVGRWDWHIWMFIVSTCLPCFGVYCLTMWIRSNLWEEHRQREEKRRQTRHKMTEEDPVQQRLSALEKELYYLRFLTLVKGNKVPSLMMGHHKERDVNGRNRDAKSEDQEKISWSEMMWEKIKCWLPFYVEPFFPPPHDNAQQHEDFTTLSRSKK